LTPVKKSLYLSLGCLLVALGIVLPATAAAEGVPDITLRKVAPAQALLGTTQKVGLIAKNPTGQKRGYNLTFRDVLPKGVAYVAGSARVAPRVLENQPAVGMTTLIFENVADLSANSTYDLSYEVEPSTSFFKFTKEHEYTNKAEAFVSRKPRNKPRFNAQGEVIAESFTGNAEDEATTELTAIEIEKSEPSPEGEILRGVHEHQTVYTLKVRNNKVGPTQGLEKVGPEEKTGIVVEDWLPAGLEFLGCGKVDNTTVTSTNPGSKEEYPGSGRIDPGNAPEAPKCVEPFFVETEETTPPGGKQPKGVYTHVKFLGPESLATGEVVELQYVAAIPIRRNTTGWPGPGGKPSAESLGQIANLDNNNGPETFDEEELTNVAQAHGVYESVPVQDTDEMTRTAEDLAIQKSVDQPKIFDKALSTWSLRLETSEYRRSEPVSISDHLPNGLCPRGEKNYEGPEGPTGGAITEPVPECVASVILTPEVEYLKGGPAKEIGKPKAIKYSFVEEETGGPNPETEGGFKIKFDDSTVAALKRLEPSEELLITYPTSTRTFYQNEFKNNPAKPVLTGDSWTNEVETEGTAFSRCFVAPKTSDPNCENPASEPIVEEPKTGTHVTDVSSASQQAGGVEIEKTVRENDGEPVPVNCKGESSEYVKGIVSPSEEKLPQYRPGDEICWRLVVKFASNLYAGKPTVSDFIPPDEKYVQGSAKKGPDNTAEAEFNEKAAEEEEALEWTVGNPGEESVESNLLFEWRFRTKVDTTSENEPGEITGNLMKFTYSNTAGQTFPLRDRAEVERLEPELSLEKTITEAGGQMIPRPGPGEKSVALAAGGDKVKYELDLENTGNLDAEDAEVWDELPEGVGCGAITLLSPPASATAKCEGGIIKWSGISVPEGELTKLTYEMKVPTDVAPGHAFVNKTGVRKYFSKTNSPAKQFEYVPAKNIDKTLTKTNTGPLLDEAEVITNAATLEKEASTETTQPGNGPGEATIGELIDYTVTAKIPPNSKIYGTPVIKDTLPSTLKLIGTPTATLDGEELPVGTVNLKSVTNGFEVLFGGPYPTTPSSKEHTVVVNLKARVLNLAANVRSETITNNATFEFKDKPEAAVTTVEKSVATEVVEPDIQVTKSKVSNPGSTTVEPGEQVEYKTEVSNGSGSGVSTANEVSVVDTVPKGMKVVPGSTGTGVVSGSTIVWQIPTLAPGATETFTYKLEVVKPAKAASSFNNVVEATTQSLPAGQGGGQARTSTFTEGGYKAAENGYSDSANVLVKLIAATVKKEVTPTEGTIGTELEYTLRMKLQPEISYFNTTLVDQLPPGITFDEFVGSECLGEAGCGVGKKIGAEPGPGNTQLVGWYFGDYGNGPARELIVRFKAHITGTARGGVKVKAADTLTNHVVGVYNEEPGTEPKTVPIPGANSFSEETNNFKLPTTVLEPKIGLTKAVTAVPAVSGEAVQPGSKLTYTLTVSNTGSSSAYDVKVVDTNTTANLRGIKAVAGKEFLKSTGPLTWVIPTIEAKKSVTLTYTAELPPSSEIVAKEAIKNTAKVPGYFGLNEKERETAAEKEGTENVREYVGPEASKNLKVELPKIGVTKTPLVENGTPDTGNAEVNKPFGWRVVVKNESTVAPAKAVSVEDLLPPNWKYVLGSTEFKAIGGAELEQSAFDPAGAATSVLTWAEIAKLPAGASVEVTFKATPSVAATENPGAPLNENVAKGTFKDSTGATGSKASGGGFAPYAAEDNAFAKLLRPILAIEKTPDGGETAAGSETHYTIKVSNNGSATAHEVQVKDVLSKNQEFVGPAVANPSTGFVEKSVEKGTPGPGETTIVWTIAEVTGSTPVTIEVPITTLPSLNDGTEITDLATVSSPDQTAKPSDPGSFTVNRFADLGIEKTAVQESVNAGEDIEYELKVENHGPSDATGIVVTDQLPTSTVFKGADPQCAEAGGVVTCELAELKLHEAHTFKVTVEVKSGTTGLVENTAKVKGDQPEPENPKFPNESTKRTPIGGLAKLAIEKIGPTKPVLLGSDFSYEIKVENKGPTDAFNATLKDPLPGNVKFLSATTTVGECDEAPGALLGCELGSMPPGAKATIVVNVEAAEVGKFTNVATFDSESSPEPKKGEATVEIVPSADLAITKTAPLTTEPGGILTYGLHVENIGPSGAHKVTITDPLPTGVEFLGASTGCKATAGTVTCVVPGELEVGEAADFQVEVKVPFGLAGGTLSNTATVGGEEADPEPENNTSTVTTTVGEAADVAIVKTGPTTPVLLGGTFSYKLEVENKGPFAAAGVKVTDPLPAEVRFLETTKPVGTTCTETGGELTCELGTLTIGAKVTIEVKVEAIALPVVGEKTLNTAEVKLSTPDPEPGNNKSTAETKIVPSADLGITKTAPLTTEPGGILTYALHVENLGPSGAHKVTVTDPLPAGVEFFAASTGCTAAAGTVTCVIPGEFEAGLAVDFQIEVKVPFALGGSTLSNTATVGGEEADPKPENNTSTVTTTVGEAADVSIVKSGPTKPVLLGGTFSYKLEVENKGPFAAPNVTVTDPLPPEVEFVEATAPTGTTCTETGGELTCELGTLAIGAKVTIEVEVEAIALSPAGGKTVNTAKVGSSLPDPEPGNNESTAETEIFPSADLAITKTAPATVEPNGELTYKLHVENLGPSEALGVKVTDPLPAGVEFLSASEGCTAASGTVTCEIQPSGELEVGEAVDLEITVKVPFALGGQALVNTATVGGEVADPNEENNTSTVTTEVGPAADLAITKTMGKAEAGKPLTYTLAITNKGPSDSSAVRVKDTLPTDTTFSSATPSQGTCSVVGQDVTCDLGPLVSGGSAQVTIVVDVAATATGTIRNVATVQGPEPDPDKSNNESSVEGPVTPVPPTPPATPTTPVTPTPPAPAAPNLKVVKTASTAAPQVGAPFQYHVEISNMGGGEAKNVKVVDTLNGPVKVESIETEAGNCSASGSTITCTIPNIAVGKTVNVTYTVVAQEAGPLKNTASAQAANGEKAPANNHAVKSVRAKAGKAKYTLRKTASRKVVEGGKKVGFTITLHNGFTAMINAKVCDRLPAALTFVKAPGARYVNGEACWTKKYVAAHKTLKLHLVARAVKSFKPRKARNVAVSSAANAGRRSASAAVRIKAAFAGKPGGVTG
jgi:large repetitive protein